MGQDHKTIFANLNVLRSHLQNVHRQYGELENPTDYEQLTLAHQSLLAIIYFIKAQGWYGLDLAFVDMMTALTNIAAGAKVDWLNSSPSKKPRTPIELAMARGRLAAIVELRKRKYGESREQAAKAVFEEMPGDSPLFAGTNQNWVTVAGWWDAIHRKPPPPDERAAYDAMMAIIGTA